MYTGKKCRAKDPSKCRVHGQQQGIIAYDRIKQILDTPPARYYLTEEERSEAPLKKLTPVGLTLALQDYTRKIGLDEEEMKHAVELAAELHRTDNRSARGQYEITAYIEHPLRNAVRATRYGVTSRAILIGCLFHDLVEDHPFELAKKTGVETTDEHEARQAAYTYIEKHYGKDVRDMTEGMSNPIVANKYTPAAEKNKMYDQHVDEATDAPNVLVGKVCDFVDNAVGLVHNKNSMSAIGIRKRATKYLPVCDILEAKLQAARKDTAFPVPEGGIDRMINQIRSGRRNLLELQAWAEKNS
jgi:(p)ppGpp synthase/HD superfamily hydrolase